VTPDNGLTLYDLNDGNTRWSIAADAIEVWFGTDGSLYTLTTEGEIVNRSLKSGAAQLTLPATAPAGVPGLGIGFSASSETVVTSVIELESGPRPGTFVVTQSPVTTEGLATAACREAGRNLTVPEWSQYVGSFDAYERTCDGRT
jgi:hypothetical protein